MRRPPCWSRKFFVAFGTEPAPGKFFMSGYKLRANGTVFAGPAFTNFLALAPPLSPVQRFIIEGDTGASPVQ